MPDDEFAEGGLGRGEEWFRPPSTKDGPLSGAFLYWEDQDDEDEDEGDSSLAEIVGAAIGAAAFGAAAGVGLGGVGLVGGVGFGGAAGGSWGSAAMGGGWTVPSTLDQGVWRAPYERTLPIQFEGNRIQPRNSSRQGELAPGIQISDRFEGNLDELSADDLPPGDEISDGFGGSSGRTDDWWSALTATDQPLRGQYGDRYDFAGPAPLGSANPGLASRVLRRIQALLPKSSAVGFQGDLAGISPLGFGGRLGFNLEFFPGADSLSEAVGLYYYYGPVVTVPPTPLYTGISLNLSGNAAISQTPDLGAESWVGGFQEWNVNGGLFAPGPTSNSSVSGGYFHDATYVWQGTEGGLSVDLWSPISNLPGVTYSETEYFPFW